MGYRKFKAEGLFTGRELLDSDSVLVTGDTGIIESILPAEDSGPGVEVFNGILCPGFINCHCHLELSHMKGIIPERTGLIDFLLSVIRQREAEPGMIAAAIQRAEEEMRQNGIVAVGDICNTAHTLAQKKRRALYYHNFIETTGFLEAMAGERFQSGLDLFDRFAAGLDFPSRSNSIVPHAPYSVSKNLFGLISRFPLNEIISIHNQESPAENSFFQEAKGDFLRLYQNLGLDISFFHPTGKRSLENYLPFFREQRSVILVHNVDTNAADLDFASGFTGPSGSIFFCICPNANLYIGGQLPDLALFSRKGCRIVIGTDSLASNQGLSILEELKTIEGFFNGISLPTLLGWATLNGAESLGIESFAGSFEPGKKPGVLLIENTGEKSLGKHARCRRLL